LAPFRQPDVGVVAHRQSVRARLHECAHARSRHRAGDVGAGPVFSGKPQPADDMERCHQRHFDRHFQPAFHFAKAALQLGAVGQCHYGVLAVAGAPRVLGSEPAAYNNDTLVGALVIAFSVLVPMMPGMSMAGMMGKPDIPPGWNYCPSTWLQRMPIAAMGVIGFLISRYLTAYQLGHIDVAWDPFFNPGTAAVITSDASKAWPIPDAGLGGIAYMAEILMAVMGNKRRWRTMPWMVLMFGFLVVPLGGVSIFFIIFQPIIIGTWCTLCLVAALAMVVMIPYSLDELVAMGQFMLDAKRRGKPLWRVFWMGDSMDGGSVDKSKEFRGSYANMLAEMVDGTTLPWTMAVSTLLGIWLLFTRLTFDTAGAMAASDHLIGALLVTFSVMAMAEVARPIRFINATFGLWLLAAPWLLGGVSSNGAVWNSILTGILLIALALPRGEIKNSYATWDRYLV
jgi:uncharacterized membrane protein